jgi:hypothetical protein
MERLRKLSGKLQSFNFRRLGLLLLAFLGCLPAFLMWHFVSTNWVNIPFWDEWHTPASQFASWCHGTLTIA